MLHCVNCPYAAFRRQSVADGKLDRRVRKSAYAFLARIWMAVKVMTGSAFWLVTV